MLRVRENVSAPAPEPLSSAAVNAFFERVRKELSLPASRVAGVGQPDVDPARWAMGAKRAGAVPVEF